MLNIVGLHRALSAGRLKLGVRWKTKSCSAWLATIGMLCTPDEPVPMTATVAR